MESTNMLLKDLIKQIRINCAMTLDQLSNYTHITRSTLSALERGKQKPQINTIKKLVDTANKRAKMNITYSDIDELHS